VFSTLNQRLIALAKSRTKPITCVECGQTFKPFAGQEIVGWTDFLTPAQCPACGHEVQLFRDLTGRAGDIPPPAVTPPQPDESRITRRDISPAERLYLLPASGNNGFLVFAVLWNGILLLILGMLLFGDSGTPRNSSGTLLFLSPLFMVGVVLAYAAVRTKYAVHLLFLGPEFIRLQRQLFGRKKDHQLSTRNVTGVELREFYQQNYQPVHGIEIAAGRKRIRFGSAMAPEEKHWLCAEIRDFLRESGRLPFSMEAAAHPPEELASLRPPAAATAQSRSGVTRENLGSAGAIFHIPASGRWGAWLFSALLATAIGGVIIFLLLNTLPRRPSGGGPTDGIFIVFSTVFGIVHLVILLLIAMLIVTFWRVALRQRYLRQQITVDRTELRLDESMFGKRKSRAVPVGEITQLDLQEITRVNHQPERAIRVATGRQSFSFGLWLPEEEKPPLLAELRQVASANGARIPQSAPPA
jgi:hypothetical protein